MRIVKIIRSMLVGGACLGTLLPPGVSSAETSRAPEIAATVVGDIALREGGRMSGRVLDADGKPVAEPQLRLTEQNTGKRLALEVDREGRFAIAGLASGVYQLTTKNGSSLCRCWAPGTAPPQARSELLVIADERIERGQRPLAEALFSTPTLLVLMIAAAIVIPIAVHNSKDAS